MSVFKPYKPFIGKTKKINSDENMLRIIRWAICNECLDLIECYFDMVDDDIMIGLAVKYNKKKLFKFIYQQRYKSMKKDVSAMIKNYIIELKRISLFQYLYNEGEQFYENDLLTAIMLHSNDCAKFLCMVGCKYDKNAMIIARNTYNHEMIEHLQYLGCPQ